MRALQRLLLGPLRVPDAPGPAHRGLSRQSDHHTVASLFYYLRWIAPAFLSRPSLPSLAPAGRWAALGAYAAGAASLALGIAGGLVLPFGAGPLLPWS